MKAIYNPSLRQEMPTQKVMIIPPRKEESILNWLENTGRLISRDIDDHGYDAVADRLIEEIAETDSYRDVDDDDDEELEDL